MATVSFNFLARFLSCFSLRLLTACPDGEFHWLISLLFFTQANYFLSENTFEMNKGVCKVEVVNVGFA